MGEKNGQERGGEGEAGEKRYGIFVEESKGAEEFVEGSSLIVGIGDGELRASGQAGAQGQKKQRHSEDERFAGRARKNRHVKLCRRGKGPPIIGNWEGIHGGV